MAGTSIKKPWVVSWPLSAGSVPLGVQRTVQAGIRREVGSDAGGPRAVGQWVRRALPITLSEQGPIGARGLPAVLISETGELGPARADPVDVNRLGAFGRAAVRAVGGLDAAGRRDGPAFPTAPSGIITLRNVLPDWAARLIVGSALLPVLLASLDALFRARRRRVRIAPWISWLFVAAVPLPVAWLWLRMLGATGWIDGPSGPMPPDRWPLETSGIVAMVSALVAGALACVGARLIARALTARASEQAPRANGRTPPVPGVEGLAVATAVWLCAVVGLAWLRNPYAAGLLIPAAHLWLFAAGGWRGATAITALLLGLVVPVLAILHLAFALDLGQIEFPLGAALGAMAGAVAGTTLLLAGWLAAFASVIRVLIARRRLGPAGGSGESIRTRGPVSYAGPGSLGGTESALRR